MGDDFLKDVTAQTSGFIPRDIKALIADAGASFVHRALFYNAEVENGNFSEIIVEGHGPVPNENSSHPFAANLLEDEDFSKALERSKKRNASALGTPKVRQTTFSLNRFSFFLEYIPSLDSYTDLLIYFYFRCQILNGKMLVDLKK